ncbi:MAG: hypothetical protein IM503_16125 [Microcystis sp. M069S2]|uniref:hypothetical protein n=1 Tax=unclassified Microcystis TaxID=2643300 RepID=UPI002584A1BC|nr:MULTISPECIES: hypothetical protein [unclassified Microcystis]MCA2629582.1 hypothetical protein [Microcystis sp. M091S2]MCA2647240.1 hypothetical protein [Microcystis sp. M069S2]MCA2663793.1 hypothetical protein [Microcystis sp. M064S2]MCA2676388.1 hypothetical protein [Microcystis sp. M054S2]MCA2771771.1 hypothetical protein [Microcystis sp. M122S2]MCA2786532.1 hypothetical protein [Microcystis sp. M116S2]MCA2906582.1 hypothetical protein [Microcystis sp. M042S1]
MRNAVKEGECNSPLQYFDEKRCISSMVGVHHLRSKCNIMDISLTWRSSQR